MHKLEPVDEQFVEMVARDVRGNLHGAQKEELHADENLDKLYDALNSLKKDVEAQLSAQKSRWAKKRHELNQQGDDGAGWVEFQASEADWRAKATRFLSAVEDHLAAAKARRRYRDSDMMHFDDLLDAVLGHETEMESDDASIIDQQMWEKAHEIAERSGRA